MDYTTAALIEGVKGKINVPTSQSLYPNDASFLQLIDRELRSRVVAFVLSLRQDFLLTRTVINLVSGQTAYDLPSRMFTPSVVKYISGSNEHDLSLIQPGEINQYGYYYLNEKIIITSSPNWSSIVLYYYRRPGFLVPKDTVNQITSVTGSTITTIGTLPSTVIAGAKIDLIENNPPFRPIDDSLTILTVTPVTVGLVTTNTIVFTTTPSTTTATLAIGDWMALENESPISQIPYEAFHYLELCSALRILMATGYMQQYGMMMKDIVQVEMDLKRMLVPRNDRQGKRITVRPFGISQFSSNRWFGR